MEGTVWTLSDSPVQEHRAKQIRSKSPASFKSAPIILETPPPDVVEQISQYFEDAFGNNAQKNTFHCNLSSTLHRESSPESSSRDSLFITQNPVPEAVRSARRSHRKPRSKFISVTDDDADGEGDGRLGAPGKSVSCGIQSQTAAKEILKQYSFPFLAKSYYSKSQSRRVRRRRGDHLSVALNASLACSAIGGFFKCVQAQSWSGRTTEESLVSPRYLDEEEPLSPLSEQEGSADEHEDIRVVDKKLHASFVTECIQAMDTESKNQTKGKQSSKEKSISPNGHIQESSRPGRLSAGRREEVPIDLERVSSAVDNSLCRDPVFSGSPTNNAYDRGGAKTSQSLRSARARKVHGGKTSSQEREQDTCSEPVVTPAWEPWRPRGSPAWEPWRPGGSPVETVPLAETLPNVDVLPQTGGVDSALLKPSLGVPELPGDGANLQDQTCDGHRLKTSKKKKREKRPDEVVDEGVQQPSSQEWSESCEPADAVIADVGEDTPCLSESSRAEPAEGAKQWQKKKKKKREKDSLSLYDPAVREEEEIAVTSPPEGDVTRAADVTMKKKKKKREKESLSLYDPAVPEEEEIAVTSPPEGDVTRAADVTMKKKKKKKREKDSLSLYDVAVREEEEIAVTSPPEDDVTRAADETMKKKKKKRAKDSLSLYDVAVREEEEIAVTSPPEGDATRAADETMKKKKKRKKENAMASITPEEEQAGTVSRPHSEVEETLGLRVDTTETSQNEFESTVVRDIENRVACGDVAELIEKPEKNTPVSSPYNCMELRQEENEVLSNPEVATLQNESMVTTERKKRRKKRKTSDLEGSERAKDSTAPLVIEINPKVNTTEVIQDTTKCSVAEGGEGVASHTSSSLLSQDTVIRDSERSEKTLSKAKKHSKNKKSKTLDNKIPVDSSGDNAGTGFNSLSHANAAETTEIEPYAKKRKNNRIGKCILVSEEKQTLEMPEVMCDRPVSLEITYPPHSRGIGSFLDLGPSVNNVSMKSNSHSLSNSAGTTEKKPHAMKKKRKNNMQDIWGNEEQQTLKMPEVKCDSTISSEIHPPHPRGKVSLPDLGKKKKTKKGKKKLFSEARLPL